MSKYPIEKPVRVLSLGAGVQSSAMLLMYLNGDLKPMPDFAIFADTKSEPEAVYDWLAILEEESKGIIPIYKPSRGNLAQDTIDGIYKKTRISAMPLHVDVNGEASMGKRQCTFDYKIEVVNQEVRRRLGYEKGQRVKHKVEMLIGISLDEIIRMKDSRTKWIKNEYPLVFEKKMRRNELIKYIEDLGLGTPLRSACWMCPFKSNKEWEDLKINDPESFALAVKFDKIVRKQRGFNHDLYLHKSLKPLDEIDFSEDKSQLDMFQMECEGMCGV
jgi:3'-phosphoadenosine 5'-phosphosulfate sulfotransferase (PAPS reductase)/FAD synthetase